MPESQSNQDTQRHPPIVATTPFISRQEPYRDLGADYFDQQRPESVKKRLIAG